MHWRRRVGADRPVPRTGQARAGTAVAVSVLVVIRHLEAMTSPATFTLRLATPVDAPALRALIPRSARGLNAGAYTDEQVEAAIRHVFGVDTTLIADGTYFVAESAGGEIVACGGWSRRATLFGGDQHKAGADPLLDPRTDAARIRAFFVAPEWARRGIGRRLIEECVAAARAAGFHRMELMATLPGVPLYAALGFEAAERVRETTADGTEIPFVRMIRTL
jgi:GNAT superfamily N-acetyltransferase